MNVVLSLTSQLIRREIEGRYRGSLLGALWNFVTPLFMLGIFTFVFAVVLKARWGATPASTTEFALIIFAGLTTFNLFAEVAGRAPSLIVSQPNLVTKVVFPLEILPVVTLGAAAFHALIAMAILLCFQFTLEGGVHMAALLVPALVLPLCLFTLGLAWLLAALGVYVRDMIQLMPTIVTAIMFLSPIFYPAASLPEWIRPVATNNPLAYSIEAVRDAVIFGTIPPLGPWVLGMVGGAVVAALGYLFFQKTRKGFADVL